VTDYDVLVAGGGPAGCAAALAVLAAGRSVALLAGDRRSRVPVGESLPPAARPLLRDLGVWDAFLSERHTRSPGNRSAWGADTVAEHEFLRDPNGLGWHLDRARFDAFLRDRASKAGADVRQATVTAATVTAADGALGGVRLTVRGGDVCSGQLVVDATGRAAAVAGRLGARRRHDDALVALVTPYAAAPGDVDARTLIEAAPDGWWYSTMVGRGRRTVAFLTDADADLASPPDPIAATTHVASLLAGARPDAPPRRAPANGAVLSPVIGPGWVAAGDAALSFDPLSAQGMLTALFTGLMAGRAVAATLDGDDGALAGYAARLRAVRAAYERNHRAYYALERRWQDQPFWRRRHSHADASGIMVTPAPDGGDAHGAAGHRSGERAARAGRL
jgi:flavin-dependent dehydrogenase